MKRIANVGDVIEYIFEGMPILASVGLVDNDAKQYGVHVTSRYSFNHTNIAQDYVYFDQVLERLPHEPFYGIHDSVHLYKVLKK
jgi:hypothetical protein